MMSAFDFRFPIHGYLLLTGLVVAATPDELLGAEEVVFNRDIQPLLSRHCFACHGPDESKREAGLRLDTKDGLLNQEASSRVVLAGNPQESELIARIFSEDADEVMPPPEFKMPLDAAQKKLLQQWVEEGANWQDHWSFEPPVSQVPPVVTDTSWVKNPIDQFILSRLEAEDLHPNPEADRATLIRRVAFDLTGLPPTPREVDTSWLMPIPRPMNGWLIAISIDISLASAWL